MIRAAVAAAFVLASPHAIAGQVRERAPAQTGTASITGRVMSDTQPARPLRRAIVTLNTAERTIGRTAVADDQGRFTIANLPAGRYLLTASKRGWVTMAYGARASGRPGRSVALADGERVTANMQLPRGAVITGVVLDQSGQPLQGAILRVLRYAYAFNTGERRLVSAAATSWGPDDRGAYRIYGLAPGEYYIAVSSPLMPFVTQRSELHLTSDVDVQEAQRAVQSGPGTPIADVPQRAVSVAPVFYPGTGVMAQATPVTLRAGEERGGVDFTVQYIGSGRVSGTIQGPDGPASTSARVFLITNNPSMPDLGFGGTRSASVDSQGKFDFADVTPGPYILAAHVATPSEAPGAGPSRIMHALAEIDAQGTDIPGLTLLLEDGFAVSGMVRFDGSATPPPFSALRVTLSAVQAANPVTISSGNMNNVGADGRFTLTGVTAGRYRLTIIPPAPWLVRSAMIGDQDSLDLPVDIRQSIADAVITLTDRPSELSGRIETVTGAAADYSIVLFPENRAMWVAPARRIQTVKTAVDGTFSFRNVPPGDYRIGAVDDVEQGEWYDPAFLQRLLPASMKVSIVEGEKKVQDIRVGGG